MHRNQINRRQSIQLCAVSVAFGGLLPAFGCTTDARNKNTKRSPAHRGELLIRGGTIVSTNGKQVADIRIVDESIREVGPDLKPTMDHSTSIDASGQFVLPGGIDPHVHLAKPWVDDFATGSQAAAAGGITSVGHMCFPFRTESIFQAVDRVSREVEKQSIVDVFIHPVIENPSVVSPDELRQLVKFGRTSIKMFMLTNGFNYLPAKVDDLLRSARELGILTMLHAEDKSILDRKIQQLKAAEKVSLAHFAASRPLAAEVVATKKAINLCQKTQSPIYVVHVSSNEAVDLCIKARANGALIFAEARPLYLHLNSDVYDRPDGALYTGMPPIRGPEHSDRLWEALQDGGFSTIASDHAAWTRQQKLDPSQTVENTKGGVSNLQEMLPMLMSRAVVGGDFGLERFVEVTSTNAAKLFGLYPRKGVIQVGSDADLVIWDPTIKKKIDGASGYSAAGYSVYDGTEVTGWPVTTILRGQVVFDGNDIVAKPGTGIVLPQKPFDVSNAPNV